MILTTSIWSRLLDLQAECRRRDAQLTRNLIKDGLKIGERDARFLYDALKYQDVISLHPTQFNSSEEIRELCLSDIHFPFQDAAALEAALAYGDEYNPTHISLLGDTIDFYKLSRFVKSPVKKSVSAELAMTKRFLKDIRLRYPTAKLLFYQGNHECRLQTYLMSQAGELFDLLDDLLETKLGFDEIGVEYIVKPYKIGRLHHLHGHEKGGGQYNPEHIVNVVFGMVLDHFICGHYHRTQEKIFKRIDQTIFHGMATGYLAGEMEYAVLNKWNQGFATIKYDAEGKFKARTHKIYNGEVF